MSRKEKKYHFIYKTTNLLSGKYYIGMHSTDNIEDGYLGSGKRLRYSINKYGVENHKREIIEYTDSRKDLVVREREVVNLNEIAKEECLNLKVGGEGGFVGVNQQIKRSVDANKKLNFKLKNDIEFRNDWLSKVSIGVKKAISEGRIMTWKTTYSWKDKKHSESTKKKISNSAKGNGVGESNSQYGTCWITKSGVNKKIKKEELEIFTREGWLKGRFLK